MVSHLSFVRKILDKGSQTKNMWIRFKSKNQLLRVKEEKILNLFYLNLKIAFLCWFKLVAQLALIGLFGSSR